MEKIPLVSEVEVAKGREGPYRLIIVPGDTVPYYTWAVCEGPVSIISISLPNALQLVQQARRHGFKTLLNRHIYATAVASHSYQSPFNRTRANSTNDFERMKNDGHSLGSTQDGVPDSETMYNVGADVESQAHDEEPLELTKIHMRTDIEVARDAMAIDV